MKLKTLPLSFLLFLLGGLISAQVFAQAPAISYPGPQTFTVGKLIAPVRMTNAGYPVPARWYGEASTFAGSGVRGSVDGLGLAAGFNHPYGVAIDKPTGNIFVVDEILVRKITPAGTVTTLKNKTDGQPIRFSNPAAAAVDAAGNVYVAESFNPGDFIAKITPSGVVSRVAGNGRYGFANGPDSVAMFGSPAGVAVDGAGNIYVGDTGNNLIRKISTGGIVSTLAGSGAKGATNGTGSAASFNSPLGVAVDGNGNVYVADAGNNLVRMITPSGVVTTLAGSGLTSPVDGPGKTAGFNVPAAVAVDAAGHVYVSDSRNHLIRRITPQGVVSTIAGSSTGGFANGIGPAASFDDPIGVAMDNSTGNLYVADWSSFLIRRINTTGYSISPDLPLGLSLDLTTGNITGTPLVSSPATTYTISGYNVDGSSTTTLSIAVNPANPAPVISYGGPQTYTQGVAITELAPTNSGGSVPATIYGQTTTVAGSEGLANTNFYSQFAVDIFGNVYIPDDRNYLIRKITPQGLVSTFAGSGSVGYANGTGTAASFYNIQSPVFDISGNLYISDSGNGIRKISPAGAVSTIAATSGISQGMAIDAARNIYAGGYSAPQVIKITPSGAVITLAGSSSAGSADGTGAAASFKSPKGAAVDAGGNVYVADYGNNLIRKISASGEVSTLAGSGSAGYKNGKGSAAGFNQPSGVAVDGAGNVYVADLGNNQIRKITPAGVVTTLAGNPDLTSGSSNGIGSAASFYLPGYVTADGNGNIYVTDHGSNSIRKISTTGYTISPELPMGLVFDMMTGKISGTPLALSPPTIYTITAYNIAGSSTTTASIAVKSSQSAPDINYAGPQIFTAGTAITPLSLVNKGGAVPATVYGQVSTLKTGKANETDIPTSFNEEPVGIGLDGAGNIYVADQDQELIRKITPQGVASTFAGNGKAGYLNGPGNLANFFLPSGLAVDITGNVYVADNLNYTVRKITPQGVVSNIGNSIPSSRPNALVVDAARNVYVAEEANIILKITPDGVASTFAGSGAEGMTNGTGTSAKFYDPGGVTIDASGNLYVADSGNEQIRKITAAGVVSTIAGTGKAGNADGAGNVASFRYPQGIAVDAEGVLYVADVANHLIRKVSASGMVSTLAGSGTAGNSDGIGTSATFAYPQGAAIGSDGNLYIVENGTSLVRKIAITGFTIKPALPQGLVFDATTGRISGTPVIASVAATYTVTGYNVAGSSTATLNITVQPATAVITFPALSLSYGNADTAPGATSNNLAAAITYTSSNPAVATIVNNKIHIVGAGTTNITASQTGDASYKAAVPVVQTLTVAPVVLTVTAANKNKNFSDVNPPLTITYAGFVNGDTQAVLTTLPIASTTATTLSAAGNYPITVTGGAAANYTFSYVPGTLAINPAPPPVITAMSTSAGITGTSVTLTGTYLAGTTSVSFGGVPAASFTINSPTSLTAVVGSGNSGNIVVTTPTGTASLSGFSYTLVLPANNFKLTVTSATCKGSNNGAVVITAALSLGYTATITGTGLNKAYPFTTSATIDNLAAGTYDLCITVSGQPAYQQCYTLVITEPKDLAMYTAVVKGTNNIVLSLSGAPLYHVNLNGQFLSTTNSQLTLTLAKGTNTITVSTDQACQGLLTKNISLNDDVVVYPNPFQNTVNVNLGQNAVQKAVITIYDINNRIVQNTSYSNRSGVIQLDLERLNMGLYLLKLVADDQETMFKIIKK